jgi:hypothetical protein
MVATSVVIVELWEQLLAWERELESRERAIATWEDGFMVFERALRRVSSECDATCV